MSRFHVVGASPGAGPISTHLSSTVTNAASAVSVACKQQQQQPGLTLLDATIGYKSPKYLAELKNARERQAKQQLPVPQPPPPPPLPSQPPQVQQIQQVQQVQLPMQLQQQQQPQQLAQVQQVPSGQIATAGSAIPTATPLTPQVVGGTMVVPVVVDASHSVVQVFYFRFAKKQSKQTIIITFLYEILKLL